MDDILYRILVNSLYLVALINPISKVSVVGVMVPDNQRKEIGFLTSKASIVAILILLGAMFAGDFLLRKIFSVELHSLRLAGGAVFFWAGFNALRNGVFFNEKMNARYSELALVPLACPMIAGPATIAATIALRAEEGIIIASFAMIIAVMINYAAMRSSKLIVSLLSRFNIMGAIIRLTGLIVMTIGVQMALDATTIWYRNL